MRRWKIAKVASVALLIFIILGVAYINYTRIDNTNATNKNEQKSEIESAISLVVYDKKVRETKNNEEENEESSTNESSHTYTYNYNFDYDFYDGFVEFKIKCKNNSDKDIIAFKGTLYVSDIFGNSITDMEVLYDKETVLAKTETDIQNLGLNVRKNNEKDMKIRDTDFEKLKFNFKIEAIAFEDGTFLGEAME